MKFKFRSLPFGFKLLFIGIVLAFLSMLLPWRTEYLTVSGGGRFYWPVSPFANGEFLIFIPYIYPLGMMLTGRIMHRWTALVLVLAPIISFFTIFRRLRFTEYWYELGIGAVLFLFLSLIAILGILIGLKHTTKELRFPFISAKTGNT